jgi:hypothetical protein
VNTGPAGGTNAFWSSGMNWIAASSSIMVQH